MKIERHCRTDRHTKWLLELLSEPKQTTKWTSGSNLWHDDHDMMMIMIMSFTRGSCWSLLCPPHNSDHKVWRRDSWEYCQPWRSAEDLSTKRLFTESTAKYEYFFIQTSWVGGGSATGHRRHPMKPWPIVTPGYLQKSHVTRAAYSLGQSEASNQVTWSVVTNQRSVFGSRDQS